MAWPPRSCSSAPGIVAKVASATSFPPPCACSAFITVIAGFVTIVMMVVEAYLPDLNQALGIYLPLIVVNCIVLGPRREVFASKHPVKDAARRPRHGRRLHPHARPHVGHPRALGAGTLPGFPYPPRHRRFHDRVHHALGGFAVLGVLIAISVVRDTAQAARGRAGRRGHRIAGRRVRVVSDVRPGSDARHNTSTQQSSSA